MAENILKFVAFSLAVAVMCQISPRSIRKYILLVSNAVFYLSISTIAGGGLFVAEIALSWCLAKFLAHHRSRFTLILCVILAVLPLAFTKYSLFLTSSLFTHGTIPFIAPVGISFYTLRIISCYADFSGYSDISNGVMMLLGFQQTENFIAPYFARGFGDFWRHWHVSLSSWLRDYVYIPLGGSRCSEARHFVNLLLTFAVSGLWHGTGGNFLFWGLCHGLLVWLSSRLKLLRNPAITFLLVMLLWIPFRASDMSSALTYCTRMFTGINLSMSSVTSMLVLFTGDNTCVLYASVLFAGITAMFVYDLALSRGKDYSFTFTMIFTVMVILFGRMGESAFIYARF